MTAGTPNRPQPGERLVKLATLLFDEPTRSTFVIPALADYQQELAEAGASTINRSLAHVRGYAAFVRLVVAAPFIVPSAPTYERTISTRGNVVSLATSNSVSTV